ncbi:alkaline-phosphatase-like protein [Xylariaceae sp. FL0255]|nr:alkaline-phosphatase-like protein [Xylariaceae sp. FL0255]
MLSISTTPWLWAYLLIAFVWACAAQSTQGPLTRKQDQPNIVFIFSDDQDLHMNSLDYMPLLKKYIADEGTTFERHFCTYSLCCPSRANLWTGKAAHNTNVTSLSPPYGGYPQFIANGFNDNYLPIWLQAAGYNTYYVGKFMNSQSVNNYDQPFAAGWTGSDFQLDPFTYEYYNVTFQRNHDPPVNHEGEYSVDLVTNKSLGFLDDAVADGKPFFLTAAPIAPHSHVIIGGYWVNSTYYNETSSTQAPPQPALRHATLFPDAIVPRTPSFNPAEPNGVGWIGNLTRQNQTNVDVNDSWYRNRLRALQSVDEMIESLVLRLEQHGVLDNTYIFFSTDNGYHIGQHRLQPGKQCAYREDVNIPMLVRGPGVPSNVITQRVSSHTDLTPTFLNLAGASGPEDYFDGRVIPLTQAELATAEQDDDNRADEHVNLEMWGIVIPEGPFGQFYYPNHTYHGLRLVGDGYHYLYTVWCTNEHELYDIIRDPYETNNLYPYPEDTVIPLFPTSSVDSILMTQTLVDTASTFTTSIIETSVNSENSNATLTDSTTLEQLAARLDALIQVLKTCKARTCTHPWEVLHPEGNVHNLLEALNTQYDHFYEVQQNKVHFDACLGGYLISNELPIAVIPYSGDHGA